MDAKLPPNIVRDNRTGVYSFKKKHCGVQFTKALGRQLERAASFSAFLVENNFFQQEKLVTPSAWEGVYQQFKSTYPSPVKLKKPRKVPETESIEVPDVEVGAAESIEVPEVEVPEVQFFPAPTVDSLVDSYRGLCRQLEVARNCRRGQQRATGGRAYYERLRPINLGKAKIREQLSTLLDETQVKQVLSPFDEAYRKKRKHRD